MITEPPADARVLFLDMNSFFARVEQQVQPIYRGRPVAVTPYTGLTGCVIAASSEAKATGVKTGMLVGDAKKECPKVVILPARPALYHFYHKEIVKTVESFSPFVKVMSIDEMSIKLTGRDRDSERAKQMAFGIKQTLHDKVGDWLTCSIGIGPNQFLAKLAGELKKPDGLFEIKLADLSPIYQSLSLTDLCGINRGLSRRCYSLGIYTPFDLYRQSLPQMSGIFGILGKVWYFRLRGYEMDNDLVPETKSIGHSHVLAPEFRTYDGAYKVLMKLVEKSGYRLRQGGYWATGLHLGVGFLGSDYWHVSKKFPAFQDNKAFATYTLALFNQCPFDSQPLSLAISASGLVKNNGRPISLFPELRKANYLSQAIDKINDHFGASTIYPASIMGAEASAPDRIPFGRPRFEIRNE